MRALSEAATGLPTILFTTALVVVVCFRLLVAVGVAEVDSFDTTGPAPVPPVLRDEADQPLRRVPGPASEGPLRTRDRAA